MFGAFGYLLFFILNKDELTSVNFCFFVTLFLFCFALSVGRLLEIYEFIFDVLLGLDMQNI